MSAVSPLAAIIPTVVKKLLQEYAVPPWWRDKNTLLYSDNTLVAVADLWVCDGWNAETDEPGLKINWQVNHVEDADDSGIATPFVVIY